MRDSAQRIVEISQDAIDRYEPHEKVDLSDALNRWWNNLPLAKKAAAQVLLEA
jgi:hypothetical protein